MADPVKACQRHHTFGAVVGISHPPDLYSAIPTRLIATSYERIRRFRLEEAQQMPILIDPMENAILGPAIRKGLQQGRTEGMQEGCLSIIRRQIKHRFGPVPEWVEARLYALSGEQLEELSDRLLDAQHLADLFELR
jgi:hypothetical protein